MNGYAVDYFAQRGSLVAKDVTPWQTFSGKGMKFWLQSYDWDGCACVSHLRMRAFFGLMRMESLICTPYSRDLPLFSYDGIVAFGKTTVLMELYDTQVEPADLSPMDAVKASYNDLPDKVMKPAWYDSLKLSPSTCKVGRSPRMSQLVTDMVTAYLGLFAGAREVERSVKTARNREYVEGLIRNGGPAINTVRGMLGDEAAETMFRRFLFGTE
ncbi:MAG: hypothetical protein K6C07_07610 [Bacteroidales bacterium]|nr:hypothetical protein [Bacteroidales bacterium]